MVSTPPPPRHHRRRIRHRLGYRTSSVSAPADMRSKTPSTSPPCRAAGVTGRLPIDLATPVLAGGAGRVEGPDCGAPADVPVEDNALRRLPSMRAPEFGSTLTEYPARVALRVPGRGHTRRCSRGLPSRWSLKSHRLPACVIAGTVQWLPSSPCRGIIGELSYVPGSSRPACSSRYGQRRGGRQGGRSSPLQLADPAAVHCLGADTALVAQYGSSPATAGFRSRGRPQGWPDHRLRFVAHRRLRCSRYSASTLPMPVDTG